MTETPEGRLAAMGLELPVAPKPAARYAPVVIENGVVYVSGQTASVGGKMLYSGVVGEDVSKEEGIECARVCALNVVAQLQMALGMLSRVRRILHVVVYVASGREFVEQHQVANGASDLLSHVFGEAGSHSRSAVGAIRLPRNSPVEVEARVLL